MVDSADKGARFIWLCNAFNIPLVYLADVAGFMVGTKVERRASSATAPRWSSHRRRPPCRRSR
jgi:acetyl-CoA carboxylase alpha subunit